MRTAGASVDELRSARRDHHGQLFRGGNVGADRLTIAGPLESNHDEN
jgi:hypothetical protein